jgi:hypothetical protein
MPQTVESAILAELERAELAARERRLAAQAEADRIHEQGRLTSEGIAAGLDARVVAELEAFRRETLERAGQEAAAIDRELAELTGSDGDGGVERSTEAGSAERSRTEAAVADVVAAVLGETGSGG